MGCGCVKKKLKQQAVASAVKPAAEPVRPSVWNGEPEKPADG